MNSQVENSPNLNFGIMKQQMKTYAHMLAFSAVVYLTYRSAWKTKYSMTASLALGGTYS